MSTRITINGVTYDDLDSMPADARRLYDEAMAKLPDLGGEPGRGEPHLFEKQLGPLQFTTVVRKTWVNGVLQDGTAPMPADVKRRVEAALSSARDGGEPGKKSELRVVFSAKGPGFSLGAPNEAPRTMPELEASRTAPELDAPHVPPPIDPPASGGGLRTTVGVVACLAAGLAFWWLTSRH